ncbi:hypothetical protein LRAMOSA05645 [Lichtheimia ramosa]|uniref:ARMC9 CTLH-like domain-containing protein n=1 Tax=Lichtheimia ramosa TaxID=688394 RepID=A0A077X1W9_9FUNG|nr:hypothetical protein LRAMOSA05645 [Lichtheimia ramosa]
MNSLYQVDELVKEYLLASYRGFTNTYRALENESRGDKDKGFQVDKILEELLGYIFNSDIHRLIDYYRYLDLRFFTRLDSRFQRTVNKFELCLLRHYLVYAIQHKRRDKVIEFFDVFGADLHGKPEWSHWFALPYVKNPAADPTFETFFTKQWTDNYMISLHNFLATTFQHMPLPALVTLNMDRVQRKAQQTEIENMKVTIDNLKATAEARENEIAKLKHEIETTRREMTDGITLIRQRAASMTNDIKAANGTHRSKQDNTLAPANATTLDQNGVNTTDAVTVEDEPFVVVSQDEYSEHASAITHAKFSAGGNLIASCDMDNIVRIWSYKGQSTFNPLKINNNASSILSMEWEARADRFLFLGTDMGTIRVFNVESKSIVQEFSVERKYPWVTQLSCSPVEPMFVGYASGNKMASDGSTQPGTLVAWSMKSMDSIGSFCFEPENENEYGNINTIELNHNGQMLVAADDQGLMRIFDVRTMKSIMEWKDPSRRSSCIAQFSFDENSIYSIDRSGQLTQWSIHKPGTSLSTHQLADFPPPAAYPRKSVSASVSNATAALPPRPTSNPSTSSLSRLSISSNRSNRLPLITADDTVTQSLLSITPRAQMVAFSADTDFCLCATASRPSASPTSENSSSSSSSATTQGTIYRVSDGQPSLRFGYQPMHQKLTTVDWTNASNACLLGSIDGSVKVTSLIKV